LILVQLNDQLLINLIASTLHNKHYICKREVFGTPTALPSKSSCKETGRIRNEEYSLKQAMVVTSLAPSHAVVPTTNPSLLRCFIVSPSIGKILVFTGSYGNLVLANNRLTINTFPKGSRSCIYMLFIVIKHIFYSLFHPNVLHLMRLLVLRHSFESSKATFRW